MKTPRWLIGEYSFVRQTFFPRWDRRQAWKLRVANHLPGVDGLCDYGACAIRLPMPEKPSGELSLVLIHEIAHAVTEVGHGAKWGRRMLAAARKARLIGEHELASLLYLEVESYRQSPKLRAADVYDRIARAASETGTRDFWRGINSVRQDLGLSRQEFLEIYPRARRVFRKAASEARQAATLLQRRRGQILAARQSR